jgi:hypothetical protein
MTEQRARIVQDLEAWRADVTAWKRGVDRLKQWDPPSGEASKGQEFEDRLAEYEARLVEHDREVSEFDRELRAYGDTLDGPRRRPKDELARHAGLWTEHLRLEVKHRGLATVHQELEQKQAELAGDAAARPS